MNKIELGNNESLANGVIENSNGTFTAVTFTQSKTFKTKASAEKWLAKRN